MLWTDELTSKNKNVFVDRSQSYWRNMKFSDRDSDEIAIIPQITAVKANELFIILLFF